MNFRFIRRRMAAAALAGACALPAFHVFAAEAVSAFDLSQQKKEVAYEQLALINAAAEINDSTGLEETSIKIGSTEDLRLRELLAGKIFVSVTADGWLAVTADADAESGVVGKLYEDSVVRVIERRPEWTKISSGNVEGYVRTENVLSRKESEERAKAILTALYPDRELSLLDAETIDGSFLAGETVEEEMARLAALEAARIAQEQARIAAEEAAAQAEAAERRQSVADYAMQFLGNPYVWGGTSLTRGADCSGFVKGVYARFGVTLPHSSYSMRGVGYSVSYSEIQPGDIVCYAGHVGIYAGNGQIVNAIDEGRGIGLSNVFYTKILTIRRIF